MSKATKLIGVFLAVLVIVLVTTNPEKLPTPLLILPFLLVFLCLLVIMRVVFRKFGVLGHRNFVLAVLAASLPVVLLALQSLGQLTIRDSAMFLALFGITYFYVYRATRSSAQK